MPVKPIPEGYHSVTPELNVSGSAKLIDFMKQAFGAEEVMRMPGPGGAIMHAEIKIGDSMVMTSDALREPPMPGSIFLYVSDIDAVYKRALQAGYTNVIWYPEGTEGWSEENYPLEERRPEPLE